MTHVSSSADTADTTRTSDPGAQPPAADPHAASEWGIPSGASRSQSTGRPTRRRFTAQYKLRILLEADQCSKPGELGVLLRREGLYSSHLCAWRRQREAGALAALAPRRRGRKPAKVESLAHERELLLRENQHLQARLRQAEMIIAMQNKVSDVLGIPMTTPEGPREGPLVST